LSALKKQTLRVARLAGSLPSRGPYFREKLATKSAFGILQAWMN
jgi:hypothetical protein